MRVLIPNRAEAREWRRYELMNARAKEAYYARDAYLEKYTACLACGYRTIAVDGIHVRCKRQILR